MKKKAFQKINTVEFSNVQSNPSILQSVFLKKNTKNHTLQPHLLILTEKFILYHENNTNSKIKRYLQLDFNTKFDILKDQDDRFTGIRFERENHSPYELFSYEHDLIRKWEIQLEKKINKRGFHQDFKVIKKIGKGNFAAVYLAIRNCDNQKVAVKAFSKHQLSAQQLGKQALVNQIKLLRLFNSRNVIKLISVYESQNSVYVVQEYLQGQSLNTVLKNQKLGLLQIKNIMKGILSGLSQISSKNVIHRDLKPQNLIFRSPEINSDIVIIDFGLATLASQKQYIFKRCGTPGFVAPQIANLKDFSLKSQSISDIFSAGIIFHIMLTGKSVFKGKSFNQVLIENRSSTFTLQQSQYKNIPVEAYDLLKRMLQKNPILRNSAQQCLKHNFIIKNIQDLEIQNSQMTKRFEGMKFSGTLEDQLGKFKMNMYKQKIEKVEKINNLHLKSQQEKVQKTPNIILHKAKITSFQKKSRTELLE